MLSRRLYRLLLKSTRSIIDKRNRELLICTVDNCQDYLSRLTFNNNDNSNDENIDNVKTSNINENDTVDKKYCFKNDLLKALRYCFEKGNTENLTIVMGLLPRLNRYLKAANVIKKYMDSKDRESMLHGAFLVSQLYHNSKVNEKEMLSSIEDGINTIVYKTIEELELFKLSTNLLEVVIDDLQNQHVVLPDEKYEINGHMYRTVDILKAFNKVLEERESARIKGNSNRIIHLVDQIFQKDVKYKDAMPLVHSVIACECLTRLGVDIRGAGIQSIFLAKICENNEVGDIKKSINTSPNIKVKPEEITGTWVALYPSGMQEISIDYQSDYIVATKVDGDIFVPANALTWKFKIPDADHHIECNVDYPGELQVAKERFSKPKLKRCKLRLIKVESKKSYHYEIIMNPQFEAGAEEITDTSEEEESMLPKRTEDHQWDPTMNLMYFFKTSDLTKIFIDTGERGAIPMSNFVLEGMIKRYSLNKQHISVISKKSTSDFVASRMVSDIYRNTVRRNINAENINYWSSITRQIESLTKERK